VAEGFGRGQAQGRAGGTPLRLRGNSEEKSVPFVNPLFSPTKKPGGHTTTQFKIRSLRQTQDKPFLNPLLADTRGRVGFPYVKPLYTAQTTLHG
jgi:hypothetical protein